jgi:hypothetical protein
MRSDHGDDSTADRADVEFRRHPADLKDFSKSTTQVLSITITMKIVAWPWRETNSWAISTYILALPGLSSGSGAARALADTTTTSSVATALCELRRQVPFGSLSSKRGSYVRLRIVLPLHGCANGVASARWWLYQHRG